MTDQASELRKMVLRAMRETPNDLGPPPRLILLTGGQLGVGVTTISVNLAVSLAEQGSRVVLIDADSHGTGVGTLCGIDAQKSLADVLVARRDIHEALLLGPAGIQVIPGLWRPGHEPEVSTMALERLMRQLAKLRKHADAVLIDVGNGANDLVRRFSQSADDVIVVTTTDQAAVMDSYARIKVTLSGHCDAVISLIVNRCGEEKVAREVYQRIDQSCRRFLGHGVEWLGMVPEGPEVESASRQALPFVLASAQKPVSRAVQGVAMSLASNPSPPAYGKAA